MARQSTSGKLQLQYSKDFNSEERLPALACQYCEVLLRIRPDALACPNCDREYPLVDGIINCSKKPNFYSHKLPESVLQQLLVDTRRYGWPKAFYQAQRRLQYDAGVLYSSVSSPRLAGWKFLLPLTSSASVLVLGTTTESVPISLAQSCGTVVAVDSTRLRLEALRETAKFRGLLNISYIHASTVEELPFLKSYFDVIIINDLQDWMRQFSHDAPRAVPIEFLKALRNFLSPSGVLYVAGDNRFTYSGLLGSSKRESESTQTEEAGESGRRARKSSTSSHSYRGYQRRLREAGFGPQHVYSPVPDHRNPIEMVDLSQPNSPALEKRLGGLLKERLQHNPHFLKAFGHSFALFASRGDDLPPSFLDEMLLRLEWQLKLPKIQIEELVFESYETAAYCRAGSLSFVLRLPYTRGAAKRTNKNAETLKALMSRRVPQQIVDLVPVWMHSSVQGNQFVTVESRAKGVQLGTCLKGLNEQEVIEQLLVVLHALSNVKSSQESQGSAPLVQQMIDSIAQRLIDPVVRRDFLVVGQQVCKVLRRLGYPEILVHGAFTPENILWDTETNTVSGLVRWHGSIGRGLPGWDLVALELSFVQRQFGCSMGEAVLWLQEEGFYRGFTEIWDRYWASARYQCAEREAVLLSYWITSIWREFLSDMAPLDYGWVRRNIISVLDRIGR